MKVEMVMPQMGESITEATISKWLKAVGDTVTKDEVILEISTDKVDSEIPSPAAGIIQELLFGEGDVVPVKKVIAVIETDASSSKGKAANGTAASASAKNKMPETIVVEEETEPSHVDEGQSRFYSPLVRSLAERHQVSYSELDTIQGSGEGGRVTKDDFMKYLESRARPGATKRAVSATPTPAASAPQKTEPPQQVAPVQAPSAPPRAPKSPSAPAPQIFDWSEDGTKTVPMDTMRQAIAEHMVRSKHTSPHVYSVQEVDMSVVAKWRAKIQNEFVKQEGFKISFTPFFLEATVRALAQFPHVNASVGEKKIILKKHINLGCAVALDNMGLIVPVIKRAEEKNFVGLARSLNDLANRARTKKLLPDDVSGGTFTVTNPGVFGTIIGTPIINQPQVAILCLGAIKKRPVVVDDMIAIREMCYLTLSYDHRIIDGSLGGQFLAFIRDYLENWDTERALY